MLLIITLLLALLITCLQFFFTAFAMIEKLAGRSDAPWRIAFNLTRWVAVITSFLIMRAAWSDSPSILDFITAVLALVGFVGHLFRRFNFTVKEKNAGITYTLRG